MTQDTLLLGDQYAPVTSSIGFIRSPLEDVTHALEAWRARLHGTCTVTPLAGGLVGNLRRLEPLTGGVRPRELLVATANPEWTALFDCGVQGGDQITTAGHLSAEMRTQAVVVVEIPDSDRSDGPQRFGARQFEMFGPLQTDFLNSVRAVSLVRDGARWRFDATGTVQDFEDLAAYESRRVTSRFTSDMLRRYAAALGLRPFEDDFYPGPSTLVVSPVEVPRGGLSLSLSEARARVGLRPPG